MTQSKWTSRKFWMSVSAQIASLVVLFWPNHASELTNMVQSLSALVMMVLSSLGYVTAESSLDRRSMDNTASGPS